MKRGDGARWWQFTLSALVAFSLVACGGGGGGGGNGALQESAEVPVNLGQPGPGDPEGRFPFAVGNLWRLQGVIVENGGAPVSFVNTLTITGTRQVDGVAATVFVESNPTNDGVAEESFSVMDANGIAHFGNTDPTDTLTPQLVPYWDLRFPLEAAGSFVQLDRKGLDFGEDLDGDGSNEKVDLRSVITVLGFETVTVPSGTFADCAKVEQRGVFTVTFSAGGSRETVNSAQTLWFAPRVGLVKRTFTLVGPAGSETVTEDLTGYRIDGIVHGDLGGEPTGPTVAVLATVPDPAHLSLANGTLFWSDASASPIKKLPPLGGEAVPLVRKMTVPGTMAVQGGEIFWTEGDTLFKSALDGPTVTALATGSQCRESRANLLADASSVYWVTSVCTPDNYTLLRIPIAGGTPVPLLTTGKAIVALAADATHIYWEEEGIGPITLPDGPEGSTLRRIPKAGGEAETLVNGALNGLIGEPPPGHLPGSWFPRGGLAVAGSEVVFADTNFSTSNRLMKIPVNGGAPTVLAQLPQAAGTLAAEGGSVFWVDAGSVNSIPLAGGDPVMLAITPNTPLGIAVSAGSVFWTETTGPAHKESGAVKSVATTGGAVTILSAGGDAPRALSLAGGNLFWTEGGPIGAIEGFGRIASMPLTGSAPFTVLSGVANPSPPMAVDATHVYIADGWRIKKVPHSGGNPETLVAADDQVAGIAVDGLHIFWVDRFANVFKVPAAGGPVLNLSTLLSGPAGPIRLTDGFVLWMDRFDSIKQVAKDGGPTVSLAVGLPFLADFVTDGTSVFFSEQDTGAIRRISLDGGAASTLIVRPPFDVRRLAVDAANLYWVDQLDVGKLPKAGGAPTFFALGSVASNPFFPGSIAVGGRLFWTETGTGEIRMAEPK